MESVSSNDGLIAAIDYFDAPMSIVGFANIHQDGILVTFSTIFELYLSRTITVACTIFRIVIDTAVGGGHASGTGTGAPDIAVVKKTYPTVQTHAIRFVIFEDNRHVDRGSIRAGEG